MTTSVENRIAPKFILSASMRHPAAVPALPPTSHAAPVDSFARAFELERELTGTVRGEVRFDRGSRALYATDGSNYRQIPIGLVIPRDADASSRPWRRAGRSVRRSCHEERGRAWRGSAATSQSCSTSDFTST